MYDALEGILTAPPVHTLGFVLAHLLWQGLLVAALLRVTLWLVPASSAAWRYGAACVALAALLLLPVGTWFVLHAETPMPQAAAAAASVPLFEATPEAVAQTAAGTSRASLEAWLPFIVLAWALGVLALTLRLAAAWGYAYWAALRGTADAPALWTARLVVLARQLGVGRTVRLRVAPAQGPYTLGWLRPLVVVPAGLLAGVPAWQVEAVLLHELAHIRRHDFAVNLLQSLAEVLLFFHPAVWWVSGQIRIAREQCCDDHAAATHGNAAEYARALLNLELLRPSAAHPALGAADGSLQARVRRLVAQPAAASPHGAGLRGFATGVLLPLVLVGTFTACDQLLTAPTPAMEREQVVLTPQMLSEPSFIRPHYAGLLRALEAEMGRPDFADTDSSFIALMAEEARLRPYYVRSFERRFDTLEEAMAYYERGRASAEKIRRGLPPDMRAHLDTSLERTHRRRLEVLKERQEAGAFSPPPPTSPRPARDTDSCEDLRPQSQAIHYSLYYEDFKHERFAEALPHAEWVLRCAPTFPRADDRVLVRTVYMLEALAAAAPDEASCRSYLERAYRWMQAAPALGAKGVTLDEAAWAEQARAFAARHRLE